MTTATTDTTTATEPTKDADSKPATKRGRGRPKGSTKKKSTAATKSDQGDSSSDRSAPESPQTVSRTYQWYGLKFADDVPEGVAAMTLPLPKGWEIPVTLERRRHFYTPRGRINHNRESKMVSDRDIRYLRLTDEQLEDLEKSLANRTIRDCGISAVPFDDDPDSISIPNPPMSDLIHIEPLTPRNWEDCWHDEYWLTLVQPLTVADANAVNVRSPGTAAAKAKANELLRALIDSDEPIVKAMKAAKQ